MNILDKIELDLLTPETTILGKIKNIIFGATTYIIWATFILTLYKLFIPEFNNIKLQFFPPSQIYQFFSMCIFAPLAEEALFRLPLSLIKTIPIEKITLFFIVFSSLLFGYVHHGIWSIPIQGVAGLIFCYVYLKNNYSYISSVSMHFLINLYYFLN